MANAKSQYQSIFIKSPTVSEVNDTMARWAEAGWTLVCVSQTASTGAGMWMFWERDVSRRDSAPPPPG